MARSDQFTEMFATEAECEYGDGAAAGTCAAAAALPCDCDWNDPMPADTRSRECSSRSSDDDWSDSRGGQVMSWRSIQHDADADGNRPTSGAATSPAAVTWYDDQTTVPGSSAGNSVTGVATQYARLRAYSATAAAVFPLYNYYAKPDKDKTLGLYQAFESDGSLPGFTGCAYTSNYDRWESTEANGAYITNAALCPFGHFGYDARCRSWYADGKTAPGGVLFTPPYVFAGSGGLIGCSTTQRVEQPGGLYVGQALNDFTPNSLIDALEERTRLVDHGFTMLVTPNADVMGADAVVAPGLNIEDGTGPLGEYVLPRDAESSALRAAFETETLAAMKRGESGESRFYRTSAQKADEASDEASTSEEEVFAVYAPVHITAMQPVDHATFAEGVTSTKTLVYSLGVAVPETALRARFAEIEVEIQDHIGGAIVGFVVAVAIVGGLVILMASMIASQVSRPIVSLLALVRNINAGNLQGDLPKIEAGACLETTHIYDAFEKLYLVVRFSNAAFLSGDSAKALAIMSEAYDLFKRLDNHKAMGVAQNNIGNIGTQVLGQLDAGALGNPELSNDGQLEAVLGNPEWSTEAKVKSVTLKNYNACVEAASGDLEAEAYGVAPEAAALAGFKSQLANRVFNRGIFLTASRLDASAGKNDLLAALALDAEVARLQPALPTFDKLRARSRGLAHLVSVAGYAPEGGAVDDPHVLLADAEAQLAAAQDGGALLLELPRQARQQQLQMSKAGLARAEGKLQEAFDLAASVIIDNQLVEGGAAMAAASLLTALAPSPKVTTGGDRGNLVKELAAGARKLSPKDGAKRKICFCLDYSGSMSGGRIMAANRNMLLIYDEYIEAWDDVAFVRFDHEVDVRFSMSNRKDYADPDLPRRIMAAANDTRGGTMFYTALFECERQCGSTGDRWIIALTDGQSGDTQYMPQVKARFAEQGINLLIVGVDLDQSVRQVVEDCCTCTAKSAYIDASGGLAAIDEAFQKVAQMMAGPSAMAMETL